jgi:hypothetical protein
VGGLWAGSPGDAAGAFGEILAEGVGLSDHATLAGMPDLVSGCATVIVFDPAASERERELAESARTVVHLRDPAGTGFAEMASAGRHALTAPLRTLYRNLRDKGECSGEDLRQVLAAPGADSETEPAPGPEQAAVLLRVLVEAGLARSTGESDARSAGIVSSEKVDLARSTTFSWQTRVHEEQVRFLRQSSN